MEMRGHEGPRVLYQGGRMPLVVRSLATGRARRGGRQDAASALAGLAASVVRSVLAMHVLDMLLGLHVVGLTAMSLVHLVLGMHSMLGVMRHAAMLLVLGVMSHAAMLLVHFVTLMTFVVSHSAMLLVLGVMSMVSVMLRHAAMLEAVVTLFGFLIHVGALAVIFFAVNATEFRSSTLHDCLLWQ